MNKGDITLSSILRVPSQGMVILNAVREDSKGVSHSLDVSISSGGIIRSVGTYESTVCLVGPHLKIDAEGFLITPGLIDIQINGAFGEEFCHSKDALYRTMKRLPECGVTSFLPTVVTQDYSWYKDVFPSIWDLPIAKEGDSRPLGWHLEGPFLNPKFCGIHDRSLLRQEKAFEADVWKNILQKGNIRLVTLSPEVSNAHKLMQLLSEHSTPIAIGHTETSLNEETEVMLRDHGVCMVTHLFNAMKPFHHRDRDSIIGAVLGDRAFMYSVIADGVHVSPEALRIAWRCYPEGMILVSDASPLLFSEKSEAIFAGSIIERHGGLSGAYEKGRPDRLAGATLSLNQQVNIIRKVLSIPFSQSVQMASELPAIVLGMSDALGRIEEEHTADCVLWRYDQESDSYRVAMTIIKGVIAYVNEELFSLDRIQLVGEEGTA